MLHIKPVKQPNRHKPAEQNTTLLSPDKVHNAGTLTESSAPVFTVVPSHLFRKYGRRAKKVYR